jgi:hypothetical protein
MVSLTAAASEGSFIVKEASGKDIAIRFSVLSKSTKSLYDR